MDKSRHLLAQQKSFRRQCRKIEALAERLALLEVSKKLLDFIGCLSKVITPESKQLPSDFPRVQAVMTIWAHSSQVNSGSQKSLISQPAKCAGSALFVKTVGTRSEIPENGTRAIIIRD